MKPKRRDSVDPESGQCSSSGATEEPSPSRERAPDTNAPGSGMGDAAETVQYTSDTEECYIAEAERELTQLVRKRLLPCLRDLIAHGMLRVCAPDSFRMLLYFSSSIIGTEQKHILLGVLIRVCAFSRASFPLRLRSFLFFFSDC